MRSCAQRKRFFFFFSPLQRAWGPVFGLCRPSSYGKSNIRGSPRSILLLTGGKGRIKFFFSGSVAAAKAPRVITVGCKSKQERESGGRVGFARLCVSYIDPSFSSEPSGARSLACTHELFLSSAYLSPLFFFFLFPPSFSFSFSTPLFSFFLGAIAAGRMGGSGSQQQPGGRPSFLPSRVEPGCEASGAARPEAGADRS